MGRLEGKNCIVTGAAGYVYHNPVPAHVRNAAKPPQYPQRSIVKSFLCLEPCRHGFRGVGTSLWTSLSRFTPTANASD
jgi:hypothetical protein